MRRTYSVIIASIIICFATTSIAQNDIPDRQFTTDLVYKIAEPALQNMANGELKKNMQVEVSQLWGDRSKDLTYKDVLAV